jgi:hypothetical protein
VEILTAALPLRAKALATLAQIVLARGSIAESLELAPRAVELFEFLGQTEEGEMQIRLVHAEALAAAGDRKAARAALALAHRRLLEQAATFEEDRLRGLYLERVPEHVKVLRLAEEWLGIDPRQASTETVQTDGPHRRGAGPQK